MSAGPSNVIHTPQMDGVTKTAILLLNLEKDVAAKLLQRLSPAQIEAVKKALASIGAVPPAIANAVLGEFCRSSRPERENRGDAATSDGPFSFLHTADAGHLLGLLQNEHPQTIALIANYLPRRRAAAILSKLDAAIQVEVARRVAALEPARPEALREVEEALSPSVSGVFLHRAPEAGGIAALAELLNCCDRATERAVLEGLGADDPELVDDIRSRMFGFEDIGRVNDRGIQALLKEIDHDELALALKTASESLMERIFANMSARARDLIREEMDYMGPVRVNEVEAAQQRIVDVVRRLEESGELTTAGRAALDEMVV